MTNNTCVICGQEYELKLKRKWRPHIYCSDKCRKIAHNERMINYQRVKRDKFNKIIRQIHVQSHISSFDSGLNIDPQELYSPRIDLNHDGWDFIPGVSNNIGTLTNNDLDVVETKDGLRIKALVNLEKRGIRK